MSDLRGVISLNEVISLQKESEWEDPNDVWVFPDGGGSEFKFIDGTVTPAPAATPLGPTYNRVTTARNITITSMGGNCRGIYSTDNLVVIAVRNNTDSILIYERKKIFIWDSSYRRVTFSTNTDDYPPGALRKISYAGAADDEYWGSSLSVDEVNGKICVGSSTGAHLWNFDGTGYVNIDKTGTGIADDFGLICACGDGKVVIGNPDEPRVYGSTTWAESGAVYVYNLDGTGEFKIQPSIAILTRSNTWSGAYLDFGTSVAIDSNRIIVGTPGLRPFSTYFGNTSYAYNGGFYTYKLDGTGETEHYGSDTLSNNLTMNTFFNRTGKYVAAKNGKIITGSGDDDQADSPNSGCVYQISTPNQTAAGSSSMSDRFLDTPRDRDRFGTRTNVGRYRRSNGTLTTIFMSMASGEGRIYWDTSASNMEDYVSGPTNNSTSPLLKEPFDVIEGHILIGDDHPTNNQASQRLYFKNIEPTSSQMVDYPPIV